MISRNGIIFGSLLAISTLVTGIFTGIIGISYPVRVDNTDLRSPIKVERINGHQIELADGRVITFGDGYSEKQWKEEVTDRIAYSKNLVDLEGDPDDPQVWIYGDHKFGPFCGTSWPPIRIPIIPNRIPRNHRSPIAHGTITKRAEPHGGQQPAASSDSK